MHRINNIRLPSPCEKSDASYWSIQLDHLDIVQSIEPMKSDFNFEDTQDWNGDWLSPMGVDLQMNGGLGISFNSLGFENLPKVLDLLDRLWQQGVEAICPTLVTCSVQKLRNSLAVLNKARKERSSRTCELLGAHMEGPFLSRDFIGAHDNHYLAIPSLSALEERIQGFEQEIALMTIAPELDGSFEVIRRLRELEVIVSLGHSNSDTSLSRKAFDAGVGMITHAFNAMPGIHHRSPGPLAEAVFNHGVFIGLIADGIHVHPTVIQMIQKLAPTRIVLVSDALSSYGIPQERFKWDDRMASVKDNVCRLDDGTLMGTTLPLLDACVRMASWTGCISSSIWSGTVSPRLALKKGNHVHEFIVGKSLNQLLRWTLDNDSQQLNWEHAR